MFSKIFTWLKVNKKPILISLGVFLLLILGRGLLQNILYGMPYSPRYNSMVEYEDYDVETSEFSSISPMSEFSSLGGGRRTGSYSLSPQVERKVVTDSRFSLLVKNVDETVSSIKTKISELGGFFVNTDINRNEDVEDATLVVRVPSEKLEEISKFLRSIAVKVVYEDVTGTDITDQYVDYEERLVSLENVKTKLEEIIERAETADEMLLIQSKIFEVQDSIDSLKGQLKYMDETSKSSKITISISTDELGLPYTPTNSWRPKIVFKQAVRSLLTTLQKVGTVAIWVLVYSPIIVAVIIVTKFIRKRKKQSITTN